MVGECRLQQLRRSYLGHLLAGSITKLGVAEEVYLRDLSTRDAVNEHAVVLREHRDVGEDLVITPLALTMP